jgi:Dolichyl-phosphate-mannose-protein mannosyltransferase
MWLPLLVLLVLLYTILLWIGTLHGNHHLHVLLLAFQYLLLLPVIFAYLRSKRNTAAEQRIALPKLATILVLFGLAAFPLSWFSARGLLNPDEMGYSFEARIFLTGHLKAAPLVGAVANIRDTPAELFFTHCVLRPDAWFSKFPPGWPAVLTTGYALSVPWVLTPILSLLSLWTTLAIGRQIFSEETGLLAVCFAVLSSFYLVNSIGMMSHAFCGLLSTVACLCLFRGLATGRLWYFVGMFGALGFALQVRPYTAFVLAIVMTTAALWLTRKNRDLRIRIFVMGCIVGGLAAGAVLLYNKLYTGSWLVSPYALAVGATAPAELSFHPARIWWGMAKYGRQSFEESLFGIFPFAYLLAGYALFAEQQRRRESWILAAIYLSLLIAYLAHPEGSGVFFGERFHFEGIYAVFLLAARGAMLLAQRWRLPRTAVVWVFSLLSFLQVSQLAEAALTVARQGEPYRRVREATALAPPGIVFLHDSPGFVAKHFNLNQADWAHAPHVFLIDADPASRDHWACLYHASIWTIAGYDPKTQSAILTSQPAKCPPLPNP